MGTPRHDTSICKRSTPQEIIEALKRAVETHRKTGTTKLTFNAIATLASQRLPEGRSTLAERLNAMNTEELKAIGFIRE